MPYGPSGVSNDQVTEPVRPGSSGPVPGPHLILTMPMSAGTGRALKMPIHNDSELRGAEGERVRRSTANSAAVQVVDATKKT